MSCLLVVFLDFLGPGELFTTVFSCAGSLSSFGPVLAWFQRNLFCTWNGIPVATPTLLYNLRMSFSLPDLVPLELLDPCFGRLKVHWPHHLLHFLFLSEVKILKLGVDVMRGCDRMGVGHWLGRQATKPDPPAEVDRVPYYG